MKGVEMEQERVECPFCKELIVKGAQKCRFCGEVINSDEISSDNPITRQSHTSNETVSKKGISLGGIFVGWITAEVVGFIIGFVIGFAMSQDQMTQSEAAFLTLYVSGPVGASIGAFVAVAIAKRHFFLHGLLVGLICIVAAILTTFVLSQGKSTLQGIITECINRKEVLISWALIILGGILGAMLSPRR